MLLFSSKRIKTEQSSEDSVTEETSSNRGHTGSWRSYCITIRLCKAHKLSIVGRFAARSRSYAMAS